MWTVLGLVLGVEDEPPVWGPRKEVHFSQIEAKALAEPKDPRKAKRLGPEGACEIRLFVDVQGKVVASEAVDCPEVFHRNAQRAAKHSTFFPLKTNGVPTPAVSRMTYTFVLD